MKKVALAVGGMVVLAGAGAAYLVVTFDPNHHKGVLIDWVKTEKQRTLVLNGPIELGVWPRLHVRLQDVSLSEFQRAEVFASVREVDLAVQLMPLLKGQLRVGRVTAAGLSMRYLRDAQGRSNLDDLLVKPDQPKTDAPGQPLSFDVEGVELKDLSAEVEDAKGGVKGRIQLVSFKSGRLADGVATDIELDAKADLKAPRELQAGVVGRLSLTPSLGTGRFDTRNVDLKVTASQAGQGQVESQITAAQALWDGEKVTAQVKDLAVALSGVVGQGASAITVKPSKLALSSFEYDPAQQALSLDKLDVQAEVAQGGHARSLSLSWPSLQVKGGSLQGGPLAGAFKVEGPVAAEGQFKSQAPSGSFQSVRLPGLSLDLKARMAGAKGEATREVAAQLSGLLQVQPSAMTGTLEGLKLSAKVTEPSLQPLNIQANGRVAVAMPLKADWGLQGDLNGNAFNTQGQFKAGEGAPNVQAKARFEQLDLNRLLPPAAPAAGPAGSAAADQAPVDLNGLRAVNGRFDVQVGQLAWQQYRVADAAVVATLQGGTLSLSQLSGAAWGGRFQAQGQAKAGAGAAQQIALQATASDVNLLAMLKDVMGKDPVEGTAQVKLNVSTSGATVGALTAALNGTASTVVRDGAVRGINLAKSLREAKAKMSGRSDAVQKAAATEKTDFTELTASFVIKQGVAHNEDLEAKSPFLRLGGAGDIHLPQRRMDYTVKATVTGTIKGQDGADIEALKGVTIPVKLSGPFDALDWRINWSGVALGSLTNTVKGQLDTKLKDEKTKLQDQLKSKLLGGAASTDPAASGAAAVKPEDAARQKLQDKLKGLFR